MIPKLTFSGIVAFGFCLIYILDFHSTLTLAKSTPCNSMFQRPATCISLQNCEPFKKILRENPYIGRRIVFNSLCSFGGNNLIVCCPQLGNNIDNSNEDNSNEDNSNEDNTNEDNNGSETTKPVVYKPPEPSECGYSNSTHDRVVGGNPATVGAWPWIALIGYGRASSRRVAFRCGGTLISKRHVVTAGHCVQGQNNLLLVRLGEYDLGSSDDGARPTDILIERATVHPHYNPDVLQNDIAILKLNEDVPFTDAIHPICLPLSDELKTKNFVGFYPFVAGWGATSYRGSPSGILQEAQVPVVNNTQCRASYRPITNLKVDDRVICAGYKQGGVDACQGDSGGPLMYPQMKKYYLIGVVSGGYRCAEPGFPGLYTRVTSFLDFILSNMT